MAMAEKRRSLPTNKNVDGTVVAIRALSSMTDDHRTRPVAINNPVTTLLTNPTPSEACHGKQFPPQTFSAKPNGHLRKSVILSACAPSNRLPDSLLDAFITQKT
uniref:Uncharacterized protein n=1 Tax=Panagrellus redivivus TaxID=6233 RepID=A0A7E4ZW56_PANRE